MMGPYKNRTLFRDTVTSVWWKVGVLMAAGGWVGVSLGSYGWLPGAIVCSLSAWQVAHTGVWAGDDDILIVHPVLGRKRVKWTDIERFEIKSFNQWMIAWVVKRDGEEVPCQGISSGRKRTQRVDIVVDKLNALLRARSDGIQAVARS